MSKIVINNLKELAALAGKLADAFKNGQCQKVGLIGPLGAGKTTFVCAVARALSYDKNTGLFYKDRKVGSSVIEDVMKESRKNVGESWLGVWS